MAFAHPHHARRGRPPAGAAPSPDHAARACGSSPLQLLLINLDDLQPVTVALPKPPTSGHAAAAAATSFSAWTLSPPTGADTRAAAAAGTAAPLQPFSKRVRLNGALLPDSVDTSSPAGTDFLGAIPAPARHGALSAGIVLPPVSVSFVCYGA